MAKKQTFGDKLKKGEGKDTFPIKVIKWYHDEVRGTRRCLDKFVQLDSLNDAATVEVSK